MPKLLHILYILSIAGLIIFISLKSDKSLLAGDNTGIEGYVVSSEDMKTAVKNAKLSIDSGSEIIYSDESGRFIFAGIKKGFHQIRASKQGFSDKLISVYVNKDKKTKAVIYLEGESRLATDSKSFDR